MSHSYHIPCDFKQCTADRVSRVLTLSSQLSLWFKRDTGRLWFLKWRRWFWLRSIICAFFEMQSHEFIMPQRPCVRGISDTMHLNWICNIHDHISSSAYYIDPYLDGHSRGQTIGVNNIQISQHTNAIVFPDNGSTIEFSTCSVQYSSALIHLPNY